MMGANDHATIQGGIELGIECGGDIHIFEGVTRSALITLAKELDVDPSSEAALHAWHETYGHRYPRTDEEWERLMTFVGLDITEVLKDRIPRRRAIAAIEGGLARLRRFQTEPTPVDTAEPKGEITSIEIDSKKCEFGTLRRRRLWDHLKSHEGRWLPVTAIFERFWDDSTAEPRNAVKSELYRMKRSLRGAGLGNCADRLRTRTERGELHLSLHLGDIFD